MQDSKLGPQGSSSIKSRYIDGILRFFGKDDTTEIKRMDPVANVEIGVAHGVLQTIRVRKTVAEVNAGFTLLSAIAGYKYRIVGATAIAYGGAVGAVTTVDLKGTQSTLQKLCAFAQASLTQSTVLNMGDSGAAVLADGASHVACDANTAITVDITGSNCTTATGIDFIVQYAIEAA